jgi:hypothetical protein
MATSESIDKEDLFHLLASSVGFGSADGSSTGSETSKHLKNGETATDISGGRDEQDADGKVINLFIC